MALGVAGGSMALGGGGIKRKAHRQLGISAALGGIASRIARHRASARHRSAAARRLGSSLSLISGGIARHRVVASASLVAAALGSSARARRLAWRNGS